MLDRFQPEILLTCGGHPVSRSLMIKARAKGTAVAFHLHHFGYNDRRGFEDVDAIIFPSEYSRRLYTRRVGIDGVVIPDPIRLDKVIAENPEPQYVTFINPQPEKGAAVFPRIRSSSVDGDRISRCWSSRAAVPLTASRGCPSISLD